MNATAPLPSAESDFELSGGRLCLDLPNTVSRRPTDSPIDRLASYGHLVAWARLADLVDDAGAWALLAEAERRPREATRVLGRARALREAVYALMHAQVVGEHGPAEALAVVNAESARALARARVIPTEAGFGWGWDDAERGTRQPSLDRPLWPVARSAAELLTSPDLALVRECASEACGWLFLDTSKNHSRRWCDMAVCGNRAKARRHYARAKRGAAATPKPGPARSPVLSG